MTNIRRLGFAIILILVTVGVIAQISAGQPTQPERSAQSDSVTKDRDIPLKNYQEILEGERKLLEAQSEKYYARVDKLIERATWFFGAAAVVVGGLLGGTFVKARKEVRESVRAKLEEAGVAQMQRELRSVRDGYQKLKDELDNITAYQRRHIKWLYPAGCALPDRSHLESAGLQNISAVPVRDDAPLAPSDLESDLIILSHEGDEAGLAKRLFARVLDAFIKRRLQTPLVVYTPKNYKLNNDEFGKLAQLELAVPANTQATLIGYVESLLRTGRIHKSV